jgi:hypothetical protein
MTCVISCFSEGNLDILDMMYGMVVSYPNWEENFLHFEDDLPDIDLRMWKL